MANLELKNINKTYGNKDNIVHALNNINLKVNQGEFISIIGKSGSGKSTLLNILGFLDTPTNGVYIYDNKNILDLNDKKISKLRNKTFGFILQFFGLINDETVFENIKIPLKYSDKFNKKNYKKLIETISKKLEIDDKLNFKPKELSGGQCQRVAIARALINDPDIILADEPTGALDNKTGNQVINILKQLNELGKTVIIVTHDTNIAKITNRVIELSDRYIISDISKDTSK